MEERRGGCQGGRPLTLHKKSTEAAMDKSGRIPSSHRLGDARGQEDPPPAPSRRASFLTTSDVVEMPSFPVAPRGESAFHSPRPALHRLDNPPPPTLPKGEFSRCGGMVVGASLVCICDPTPPLLQSFIRHSLHQRGHPHCRQSQHCCHPCHH